VLRDAAIVAGKDLQIEWRSRVSLNQVAPFALVFLVLFAFAADARSDLLGPFAAGLFWVAVLLVTILAVQRSVEVERPDGLVDALRLSGLHPGGLFLGKAAAVAVQLLVLEALLGIGIVVLYDVTVAAIGLWLVTCLVATVALASAGTIYGALSLGLRTRETLLPLLLVPIVAPVVLAATRAHERALDVSTVSGWRWVALLGVMAVIYAGAGLLAYGPLLEES
jgi:heme exporter protein B